MSALAKLQRFDAGDKKYYRNRMVGDSWLSRRFEEWQDIDAYRQDILDFLTSLGPGKVISVQAPAGWYRFSHAATDVWYWEEA